MILLHVHICNYMDYFVCVISHLKLFPMTGKLYAIWLQILENKTTCTTMTLVHTLKQYQYNVGLVEERRK